MDLCPSSMAALCCGESASACILGRSSWFILGGRFAGSQAREYSGSIITSFSRMLSSLKVSNFYITFVTFT
jgi:hypothetical protein